MTDYYLGAAGSNTAPYNTWAKAANSIDTIGAIDAAGDTIYIDSTFSQTGSLALNFAGTISAPTRIISADKTSGEPPLTIAAGAVLTSTSNGNIGGVVYAYGIAFISSGNWTITNANSYCESCSFQTTSTSAVSLVVISGGAIWKNVALKFGSASQNISVTRALAWVGGSVLAGGISPTTLVVTTSAHLQVSDVDLSNCSSALVLTSSTTNTNSADFRNMTMPSGWTGVLNSNTRPLTAIKTHGVTLINGDYAATNYAYQRWDNFGDVYHETTNVRTGGASDGTTPLAWKLVSQAHAATFPICRLECAELTFWNRTVGVARTVTLEYLHDSVTGLKNDEFGIDVEYLGSGSTPIGSLASSAKGDVLQAGSTNPSSAAVWNVTGLSNPNAQSVSVTFTPQMVGLFIVRMWLCKASYILYADRKVTVTT